MAAKQNMLLAITQAAIVTPKAAIMAAKEAENPVNAVRSVQVILRVGSPKVKQPTFDWKAAGKLQELCNFQTQVKNIFLANSYNTQDKEKVPIILNWPCREVLQFVQTKNDK